MLHGSFCLAAAILRRLGHMAFGCGSLVMGTAADDAATECRKQTADYVGKYRSYARHTQWHVPCAAAALA